MDEHRHTSHPGRTTLRLAAAVALALAVTMATLARPAGATGGTGRSPAAHRAATTPPSTVDVSHMVSAREDGAGAPAPADAPTTGETPGRAAAWWVLGITVSITGGSALARGVDRRRRRGRAAHGRIRL